MNSEAAVVAPAAMQTLWVGGRLSTMERLCLNSFLHHGHPVHLYVYEAVQGIPDGVVVRDGNEILPQSMIFTYSEFRTYAGFANFFRARLLLERGGWWIDTDTVCLRPLDFTGEYVFCSERHPDGTQRVNNAVMKVPAGSPLMEEAWRRCQATDIATMQWGQCGPRLLAELLQRESRPVHVAAPDVFCPIDFYEWERVLSAETAPNLSAGTYAIHLWNEMWRRACRDKDAPYPPGCLYERLKQRYLTTQAVDPAQNSGAEKPALHHEIVELRRCEEPEISALVLSRNGAQRLARCLESIVRSRLADELVVCIDDGTTDDTASLASHFTHNIHFVSTRGYIESVLPEITSHCHGQWVLRVDDDETLEGKWDRQQIESQLRIHGATHVRICRRWLVPPGDRFIADPPWFPDHQLRLFRNLPELLSWPAQIHEPIGVRGGCLTLADAWIDHHLLAISDRPSREAKCSYYRNLRPEKHLSHFYLFEDSEPELLTADAAGFLEAQSRTLERAGNCAVTASRNHLYRLGNEVDFCLGGNASLYQGPGWSYPESWGTWTDGFRAGLLFRLQGMHGPWPATAKLVIDAHPYVNPAHPAIRVLLVKEQQVLADWLMNSWEFRRLEAFVPIAAPEEAERLTLSLHFINPASPAGCGESEDPRVLGLGVRKLVLEHHECRGAHEESAVVAATGTYSGGNYQLWKRWPIFSFLVRR